MTSRTPQWFEARNLALHELVADELRHKPHLFAIVRSNLARWEAQRASPGAAYLAWREVFDEGLDAALAVAIERSERANELRSASPFTGVLAEQTRLAFLENWERHPGR